MEKIEIVDRPAAAKIPGMGFWAGIEQNLLDHPGKAVRFADLGMTDLDLLEAIERYTGGHLRFRHEDGHFVLWRDRLGIGGSE